MKGKTIKLLEENVGEYLCDFGTGKDLLKKIPIYSTYRKIDKFDYVKVQT